MRFYAYVFLTVALVLASATYRAAATEAPTVSEMQIIHDSEPIGEKLGHDYTFVAASQTPLGQCYYEVSFFDEQGAFIGYSNGAPDLSFGSARCNGTVYLSGIAASFEITWQHSGAAQPEPEAALKAQIKVADIQWKHDSEPIVDQYGHDFTFKASGPVELGEVYFEVAFFNADGGFIGYSNGFADFSGGSSRCTGTAYLKGIAEECDITWQ
jgi:hypothetical protein